MLQESNISCLYVFNHNSMINENSIVAKDLNCYQQNPEKSERRERKRSRRLNDCGSRASSCIKRDQKEKGQGSTGREAVGAVFSLPFGRLTDLCATMVLGGYSYT